MGQLRTHILFCQSHLYGSIRFVFFYKEEKNKVLVISISQLFIYLFIHFEKEKRDIRE